MTRKGIVVGYYNNDYYRENIFITNRSDIVLEDSSFDMFAHSPKSTVQVKDIIKEAYPIGKEVEIITVRPQCDSKTIKMCPHKGICCLLGFEGKEAYIVHTACMINFKEL